MDPTTSLSEILITLSTPDIDPRSVVFHLRDLADWLDKGGFVPDMNVIAEIMAKMVPNEGH